jgi:large subunit ribosomal protein L5
MREIRIEKLTLNVGVGKEQNKLEKAILLLKNITGIDPVKTYAKKRIPAWGLRPGLPIGCKITIRGKKAEELISRLLVAKDNKLKETQIDNNGNIAFGIHEYIDIPDIKYDPKIGIIGFEACITLERPGFRTKKRRVKKSKISKKDLVHKEGVVPSIKNKITVNFGDE